MKNGTLFGVGVGCGDPDSLTMKAVKALKFVDVIFVASSSNNTYSIVEEIIQNYIDSAKVQMLAFPMAHSTKEMQEEAWETHTCTIMEQIYLGKNCAFVTLGDPLIYSTFGYIMNAILRKDVDIPIEVIPGITSFQELAAKTKTILCNGEQGLYILPALGQKRIISALAEKDDTIVLLRIAKEYSCTVQAIEEARRNTAIFASNMFRKNEIIHYTLPKKKECIPYLSLCIMPAHKKD